MTRQLQFERSASICPTVILSRLFAMFIALSLLLGPLAMDRAMAAAPAAGHSQMTDDAHCQPADDGKTAKAMSEPCCAAMCATPALVSQERTGELLFGRLAAVPAAASFHRGVLSEISTPPPRLA